jgi:NADPH:quinone reductase-like Zn-dependent oxidoreductase
MENMKAVRMHNYGGPEVLRFEDAPRPTPGAGELLIRVFATSVNAITAVRDGEAHIPGALNIPPERIKELAPQLLPKKDAEIVTYCTNTH